jgi:vancomycin aglycone glucosyltransferase
MRVLLSTIGSRGDVQPLVALGIELKTLGHGVRLCVPPDFREWIEGLGISVTPIGPELRSIGKTNSAATLTPDQRRQMIEGTVATQFETIASAAQGCDVIVGATTLQIAAPSIAEHLGVPYAFAAYSPNVIPSRHHAPTLLRALGDTPAPRLDDYSDLWAKEKQRWNEGWRDLLNAHRARLGLEPVDDVLSHVLTDRPWLAADRTLAPWPHDEPTNVFPTGAWLLRDDRPLAPDVEAFLDAGDPPIYFGFGSVRAPESLARTMIEAARALGRRAILLQGWGELSLLDDGSDCIAIGEVNQQTLFKRVAAVVHHGGAGTTTAAARAGAPQVVVPQHYDQPYWASRVAELGIGVAHFDSAPTTTSLVDALREALTPLTETRARATGSRVSIGGTLVAAERLIQLTATRSSPPSV